MKGLARLCIVLMVWSFAPWQLMCLDHDHHIQTIGVVFEQQETSVSLHGCQLDFFAPFHHTASSIYIHNDFSNAFLSRTEIEKPFLTLGRADGRAPPAIIATV